MVNPSLNEQRFSFAQRSRRLHSAPIFLTRLFSSVISYRSAKSALQKDEMSPPIADNPIRIDDSADGVFIHEDARWSSRCDLIIVNVPAYARRKHERHHPSAASHQAR